MPALEKKQRRNLDLLRVFPGEITEPENNKFIVIYQTYHRSMTYA